MPRLLLPAVSALLAAILLLPVAAPVRAASAPTEPPAADPAPTPAPAPAGTPLSNRLEPGEVHGYRLRTGAAGDFTVTAAPGPALLLELRKGDTTAVVARRVLSPADGPGAWNVPQVPAGDYTLVLALLGKQPAGEYRLTLAAGGLSLNPGVPRLTAFAGNRPWFVAAGTTQWSTAALKAEPHPVTAPAQVVLVVDSDVRQTVKHLPAQFNLDTTKFGDGVHQVAVLAQDAGGNWAGRAQQMLVDNLSSFTDLAPAHWARAEVELLADLRLTSGYPDRTFRPERPVTRAEFVKFLVAAAGFQTELPAQPTFADVPRDAWFFRYVEVARHTGIVQGQAGPAGAQLFRPEDHITRAEAAAMIARAAGLGEEAERRRQDPLDFRDAASIPRWAVGAIAAARVQGLIQGYPDGTFGPADPVTRAQAAVLVARLVH